jgi:hypothetical protein
VGNGAFGSTFQPVGVGVGQAGCVNPEAEEAYADEATPVGDRVAHWAWRFEKSGEIGVGVPCRENLTSGLLADIKPTVHELVKVLTRQSQLYRL